MDRRPIGVFDSGLGGLTAVSEIMRILPGEDIIYLGDTARVPYGTRSENTITRYTRENIEFLKSFDIKALLMACGTVSSVSLPVIKDEYDMPIIGVVSPAASSAARATRNGKIGIIGTSATIKSRSYEREILSLLPTAELTTNACPLFVPLVENGRTGEDDAVLNMVAEEYLEPMIKAGVDTLVMGCTHYPIIERVIAKIMGNGVSLINPGLEGARYLRDCGRVEMSEKSVGEHRFFVSDDKDGFMENAAKFLGCKLCGSVSVVSAER